MPNSGIAALAAENQRLKADIAQRDQAARTAAQQTIHANSVQYAEQLVAAGMKPVHAPVVIAALDFAQASDTRMRRSMRRRFRRRMCGRC